MLTVAFKYIIILSENSFEKIGPYHRLLSAPHFSYQFGPCLDDSAIRSKRILVFSIKQRFVLSCQEILCKFINIRQALNTTIHIASVPKINQPYQPAPRILIDLITILLPQFIISIEHTFINMESLVILHAFIITILHLFAFANGEHYVLLIAILTDVYDHLLSFQEFECEALVWRFSIFDYDVCNVIVCYGVNS